MRALISGVFVSLYTGTDSLETYGINCCLIAANAVSEPRQNKFQSSSRKPMIRRKLLLSMLVGLMAPAAIFAQSSTGPDVGSVIDEFSLTDQHGTSHDLSTLIENGPVAVVVFRSADW